jgi:hypothetical protein
MTTITFHSVKLSSPLDTPHWAFLSRAASICAFIGSVVVACLYLPVW